MSGRIHRERGQQQQFIPELTADPTSPSNGEAWVKKATGGGSGGGAPVGLLAAITVPNSGGSTTYTLSFKTISDGIKTVTLT